MRARGARGPTHVAQGHPSGHSGAQGPPTDSWGASEDTFLSGVVATLVLGPEELGREETPPTWWAQGHGDTEWTRGSVSVPVPLGRATRGAAASQDSARQDLEGRNGSVARVAPAARAREPRSPSRTRRSPRTAPEPTCRSRCQSVGAPGGGGLAPEVTRSLPAAAAAAAMAHITINQYLQQVYEAIDTRDGASCAELVSFKHPHVANPRLQMASPEEKCQQVLEPPYDEMFAAHLRCTYAVGNHDFIEAYKCQTVIVQSFLRAFQAHKEENWALPVMYAVALDLRVFANNADQQLVKKGKSKVGDMLEKAAELLMSCFRVCASDT
uniref:Uncharacterized protein LOC109686928 n=1 Tax=Castor canadensis TaxID=51338 RepID=A0A8B7UPG1_CASCN|nr:uncharacterized protein LOC109686928 [Castor canadensis]